MIKLLVKVYFFIASTVILGAIILRDSDLLFSGFTIFTSSIGLLIADALIKEK